MTIVMGAGIATIQPAFPSLARAWFGDRIALGTGIWANGLLVRRGDQRVAHDPVRAAARSEVPGNAASRPGASRSWSPRLALSAVRDPTRPTLVTSGAWLPNFRDARVWQLGVFQSAASLAYFGANTFLPDYLHAIGSVALVGAALAALNIGQIPASLAVGLIPMRILGRPVTSLIVAGVDRRRGRRRAAPRRHRNRHRRGAARLDGGVHSHPELRIAALSAPAHKCRGWRLARSRSAMRSHSSRRCSQEPPGMRRMSRRRRSYRSSWRR